MRIDLLGAEFNIKTDQNPEYLAEVVALYRSKVEEIQASVATSDSLKVAILAGILTADEYLKQTSKSRSANDEAERITGALIRELEDALTDEPTRDEI